jgi:hypothetical protein
VAGRDSVEPIGGDHLKKFIAKLSARFLNADLVGGSNSRNVGSARVHRNPKALTHGPAVLDIGVSFWALGMVEMGCSNVETGLGQEVQKAG